MRKAKILIPVFGFIVILVVSLSIMFKVMYTIPILMYHSVAPNGGPKNKLMVEPKSFDRQMRFLKRHHYNVVPLEALADLVKNKKKIPPKTIAITFDDGFKDNYIYAFPVLKKYNLPATIFVITNEVGRSLGDRLTWDEIYEMRDSGVISFGSHCLGAKPLIEIDSDEWLKREIVDSRKVLEEKLGRPVNTFSYPQGKFNARVRQAVIDAGYDLAVTTAPGKRFPDDDRFALKRVRVSPTSDNLLVFWISASGIYTFIKERRDKD